MVKIAYLDCPTGIAGDMCLGAIIDAGMPLDYLIEQLASLGIEDEYRLWSEDVHRNGQRATKVHIELVFSDYTSSSENSSPLNELHSESHGDSDDDYEHHHHEIEGQSHAHTGTHSNHSHHANHHKRTRYLPDIEHLIQSAQLPSRVKTWSLAIFQQLANAEGAVHGISPEQVHFHEVGAVDAIADIVGTCIGLDWLNIDQLYCSALPTGGGTVWAAHGRLPVPAPAVLHLLQMGKVPIYSNGINRELVTPTGAAIATTLAMAFGSPPAMTLKKVGLGAGNRDLEIPNILRLWMGESTQRSQNRNTSQQVPHSHHPPQKHHMGIAPSKPNNTPPDSTQENVESTAYEVQTITVLETHLDDLDPQIIGYVFDQLLDIGALDVFTQAVGMKKSRPGILLTVLCSPELQEICEAIIYRETTTLGIRRRCQQRSILHREFQTVSTPYGPVKVKLARDKPDGQIINTKPEYEDCAGLARKNHVSLSKVYDAAIHASQP